LPLTPEQEVEVIAEYRRVRSPFKVANNLGFDVTDVWSVIEQNPDAAAQNVERWGGEGRPDLRPFFVAKSRCSDRWDNDDPAIAAARVAYEAGTHDMMTHRDGAFKFLVLKPQRRTTPRPDYFKPEVQL
jgi:hypothetical protein